MKYLYKEIEALKRVDHKNIIKLWSFCTDINDNIILILEYAEGGSLKGINKNSSKIYKISRLSQPPKETH